MAVPGETARDQKLLAQRLLVAVVAPVALLLLVGLLLAFQLVRLTDTAHSVDHTDEVIGRLSEIQTQIADQEAAIRGYLLTADRTFLAPYHRSQPLPLFASVHALVADNPPQQVRADVARARYESWLEVTAPILVPDMDLRPYRTAPALAERRQRSDAIRDAIQDMLLIEQGLRVERAQAYADSNRLTTILGLPLFLALATGLAFLSRKQLSDVSARYRALLEGERTARAVVESQNWVRTQQTKLADAIQGDFPPEELGQRALQQLCDPVGAVAGSFFLAEAAGFRRLASLGSDGEAGAFFAHGEGLVGRAARTRGVVHVKDVPKEYSRVRSGTGERLASELALVAAGVDGEAEAVLEFAFFTPIRERALELLSRVAETMGVALRSAQQRRRLADLLEESQRQGEELQTQQEELRVANEELQQQGDVLRRAHTQLEEGKEELEVTNASLSLQRDALEKAQTTLAEKMTELQRASRYKSEFLANMSHELRTPLNSSLILAKLLADNKDGNLNEEQIKFANTIYSAGNDLLALINDILDLSKIEAGKLELRSQPITLQQLLEPVRRIFEPVASQKHLEFPVVLEDSQAVIETDGQRAQQILKNLLSNAFKFTERGQVSLGVTEHEQGYTFCVRDSGIGIPKHQHDTIFEAFQQADGTTNRRFGGTGLGLSISRDLARMLGGDLSVESELGKGSAFTLTLPKVFSARPSSLIAPPIPSSNRYAEANVPQAHASRSEPAPPLETPAFEDDRERIDSQRRLLLIIEDDPHFAEILANLAKELSFQFLLAHSAQEGIRLATQFLPAAIILDVNLPDHSGLMALDRLKQNGSTRHIPVHVMSVEDYSHMALLMGAAGYLLKPARREDLVTVFSGLKERFSRMRRLLIVEDDAVQRNAVTQLLSSQDVEIVAAATVAEATRHLAAGAFDCVVTDLSLPDATGYDLIEQMASADHYAFPPVIVYTGRCLTPEEEQRLRRFSSSIIVKGARSPERLLDEVSLFLHQVEATLPADRQRMLRRVRDREAAFDGRTILVAEDDVRNIFALSSILEPKGAKLLIARNGREALDHLAGAPEVNLVLMDIMMPEMDGLEAMRRIRASGERWSKVPIIALTAKAMTDDRDLCIEAGANDYIAKPLNVEILLSLVRVWLHEQ
jgi:signal transduction histidine kinase/DNA-binding response OmpR family regulator/CHASE3 domain sensor protein